MGENECCMCVRLYFKGTSQPEENLHIENKVELVLHTLTDVPSIGWLFESRLCVDGW